MKRVASSRWLMSLGTRARTAGILLLAVLILAFVFAPSITSRDPAAILGAPLQAPSPDFLLGTDFLGRDVLTRLFYAGRTDALVVIVGMLLCYTIGTILGVAMAMTGPRIQALCLRILDGLQAFPFIILVLMVVVLAGDNQIIPFFPPGTATLILAIVLVGWTPYARLAAAQTNVLKKRESVIAAQMLAYSRFRVLFHHLMPSVAGVNLSYAASNAVAITGLTASLSFLGAGVQEPTAELGAMMNDGLPVLATAWWLTVAPGAVVMLLGLGFILIGDSRASRR